MKDHIEINDELFYQTGYESRGGKVLKEIYFSVTRSGLKVEIDYTHTTKGCK